MFIGENLWLTVASLVSMQFAKNTGFDKGKLIVMESVAINLHLFNHIEAPC